MLLFNSMTNIFKTNYFKCAFWNARGIMYSSNHFCYLLQKEHIDVFALYEHWLFEDSLNYLNTLDPGYASIGVSDASINPHNPNRRGKGGVALLWKKSILTTSIVIQDEDRIIETSLKSNSGSIFYVFAVYLPSTNHNINEFTEYVDKLYNLYLEYSSMGTVIFLGDINAEISGTRYNARPGNRQQIMNDFLETTGLYSPVSDTICKGPLYTFSPYESGACFTKHIRSS